jgi:hypothetical protein
MRRGVDKATVSRLRWFMAAMLVSLLMWAGAIWALVKVVRRLSGG